MAQIYVGTAVHREAVFTAVLPEVGGEPQVYPRGCKEPARPTSLQSRVGRCGPGPMRVTGEFQQQQGMRFHECHRPLIWSSELRWRVPLPQQATPV